MNVEPDGLVVLTGNGPFTIYVRASLNLKGPLARPAGAPAVATMVAFAGTTGVYVSAPFEGSLVAPNATITLANIGTTRFHDASFFSRGIDVQASVRIRHRPMPIGPPETLSPPAPGGGEFRCALVGRSAITLGSNATSSLLGTLNLTLKPNGAVTLDGLVGRGSSVCSGNTCSTVALRPDPAVVNVGSFSPSDGAVQLNLAGLVRFADRSNRDTAVFLGLRGSLQHRRLSAFATGALPANAPMFAGAPMALSITCDQQEPRQVVDATFTVGAAGAITASAVVRTGNRPALTRDSQGYLLRTFDAQGGRLDELSFSDPRVQFDAAPLATSSTTLRIPFANGIRTLVLDGPAGPGLIQLDLTSAATAFCATRPTNPECRRLADPTGILPTTLALSTGTDSVPGVNTPRALGREIHVALPANVQGFSPNDFSPSVAAIPSGTIGVTWLHNASQSKDVRLRFFDRDGVPLADAQGLVTSGSVPTGKAHVTGSSAGQFVVVWEEIVLSTLGTNVIAQRFSAAGQPAGSRVTVVGTTADSSPVGSNAALDGTGRFLVTWIEVKSDGTSTLGVRRFNTADQPDGGVITVSTNQQNLPPVIAADDLGRFVIVYNETRIGITPNVFRRFNQNLGAAAPTDLHGDSAPDLAIAMAPDSGEFTVLQSRNSQVLGSVFQADGALKTDETGNGLRDIRLDGRAFGSQRRPSVAILPGGETFVSWSSSTIRSRSEIRVSGQSFTSTFVPMDVDFDAGLSRIDTQPVGEQGFDPAPRVAALGDRFAAVWETLGGIRMQLFKNGPYACPANLNCGTGLPLMVNGDPENVYNLIIVRGDPCYPGKLDPLIGKTNPNSFARLAATHVATSFFEENIESNRRRLNVFVSETGDCRGGILDGTPYVDMDSIAFASDILGGISTPNRQFRFGFEELGTFRHEAGHSMFDLADEYPCKAGGSLETVYFQAKLHGNLFTDLATCMALSASPAGCRLLDGAPAACQPLGPWSRADRDDDVMTGGGALPSGPFGLDCKLQISEIFQRIPCPGTGSSGCQ